MSFILPEITENGCSVCPPLFVMNMIINANCGPASPGYQKFSEVRGISNLRENPTENPVIFLVANIHRELLASSQPGEPRPGSSSRLRWGPLSQSGGRGSPRPWWPAVGWLGGTGRSWCSVPPVRVMIRCLLSLFFSSYEFECTLRIKTHLCNVYLHCH